MTFSWGKAMIKERAKQFRQFIEQMAKSVDDETALDHIEAFPKWEVNKAYVKDDRVRYENILYKVLQNHTSQSDWTPNVAVSLFVKISIEEYPQWVQPTGSHDAYQKGDKVAHKEKHWVSDVDNNVWEPSVYGWSEV